MGYPVYDGMPLETVEASLEVGMPAEAANSEYSSSTECEIGQPTHTGLQRAVPRDQIALDRFPPSPQRETGGRRCRPRLAAPRLDLGFPGPSLAAKYIRVESRSSPGWLYSGTRPSG